MHRLIVLLGAWIAPASDAAALEDGDAAGDAGEHGFDVVDDLARAVLQSEPEQPEPEPDWTLDLTPSVFIAGILHIIHKAIEELENVLCYLSTYVPKLRHVTGLLRRKWSRTRLLSTCFARPPQSTYRWLYSSFFAGVFTGRWGSVMEAVGSILPLEASLKFVWSLQRYQFGSPGEAPPPEDDKSTDLNIVDEAIRSCLFWAYTHSLDVIAETLELISVWAEACPCHSPELRLNGARRHSKQH